MTPFKSRLKGLWKLLTSRNFILIHHIEKGEDRGMKTTKVTVWRRTDHDTEEDYLSMKAGLFASFPEYFPNMKKVEDITDEEVEQLKKRGE